MDIMKRNFLLCILFTNLGHVFGQDQKEPFFINEITVSLHRTCVQNENTMDRYGLGLGMYRVIWIKRKFNVIPGIEYNLTSQIKKFDIIRKVGYFKDVKYTIHTISLPLNFRYSFFNSVKASIEAGIFADINCFATMTGYKISSNNPNNPNVNTHFFKSNYHLEKKMNYGAQASIGIILPLKKYQLFAKIGYKHGFRMIESYTTSLFNHYFKIILGVNRL
jgi:hypothetical protein